MTKAKKTKLPKRVAGVKIPKELRKGADRLLATAQTPEGRAAIAKGAATVASAAAALAQAAAKARPAATPVAQPVAEPVGSGTARPDAVADAIGAGVEMVLGRLFAKR